MPCGTKLKRWKSSQALNGPKQATHHLNRTSYVWMLANLNFLFVFFFSIHLSFAGGFPGHFGGIKSSGMAGTNSYDNGDASILFSNPALLVGISRSIVLGTSLQSPQTIFVEEGTRKTFDMLNQKVYTPVFAASYRSLKDSSWAIGVGLNSPFNLENRWEHGWLGRFVSTDFGIKTLRFHLGGSYLLKQKFAIGAGFNYSTVKFDYRVALPYYDQDNIGSSLKFETTAQTIGFNAGLVVLVKQKAAVGIAFRSNTRFEFNEQDFELTVPSVLVDSFPAESFNSTFEFPWTVDLTFSYSAKKDVDVGAALEFHAWGSVDELIIDFSENSNYQEDISVLGKFQHAATARLGVEYNPEKKYQLRGGISYRLSPVKSGSLFPQLPDADNLGLSIGCTAELSKQFHLDFSLVYLEYARRKESRNQNKEQLGGTYKSKSVIPGIALTWRY